MIFYIYIKLQNLKKSKQGNKKFIYITILRDREEASRQAHF